MSHNCWRAALLSGASLSVLSSAAPAFAATSTRPGILHTEVAGNVSDTLVICDIADLPTSPCFYGVTDSASPAQAIIASSADGQIAQIGIASTGDVHLDMLNDGIAVQTAFALATSTPATAIASIDTGVLQSGVGPADVSVDFTNQGAIAIHGLASASNLAAPAHAMSAINGGLVQRANSTGAGDAQIDLINNGQLEIAATASAHGIGTASATAVVATGLAQSAHSTSGNASSRLTNEDEIKVNAQANAVAGTGIAVAVAAAISGVAQSANATDGGNADDQLINDGTIDFNVKAHANGPKFATAGAALVNGITQSAAAANGGSASAMLDNAGTISGIASAVAQGSSALASAFESRVLVQSAQGSGTSGNPAHAEASLANSGSIAIGGLAQAEAGSSTALAHVVGRELIGQEVSGIGVVANAAFTNDGEISLNEEARATGNGPAFAGVTLSSALIQEVRATSGDASGEFHNNGTISIGAVAHASGVGQLIASTTTSSTAPAAGVLALAGNVGAIRQNIVTILGGNASANFENAGLVNVYASASAVGDGRIANIAATASGNLGIYETASAFRSSSATTGARADATANFLNSGSIELTANAKAEAVSGGAATAAAFNFTELAVAAAASNGNATSKIENTGSVTIGGVANANVDAGTGTEPSSAIARANVQFVVSHQVTARDGSAAGTILNEGSLDILSLANALAETGHAEAVAAIFGGIRALATGNTAAHDLFDNSGSIQIAAGAEATGDDALAQAGLILGINDRVQTLAGNASGEFQNEGTILLHSAANAHAAVGSATARAAFIAGVEQIVQADGGDASGRFANSGSINEVAMALATAATHASAGAFGLDGVVQAVQARGGGLANADWQNDGSIMQLAVAGAHGASATAIAQNQFAVVQDAEGLRGFATTFTTSGTTFSTVPAGDASALLSNSGSIMVAALANATATAGRAAATVTGNEIVLQQVGTPDGNANAELINSGSIDVFDHAVAVGASASAFGFVASDVLQTVQAGNGDAVAALDNQGTIDVTLIVDASAEGNASALGVLAGSIFQSVLGLGHDGSATISNEGEIQLAAVAHAIGGGHASAFAQDVGGILQTELLGGSGDAAGDFANSGAIAEYASAVAQGASASAFARNAGGIFQSIQAVSSLMTTSSGGVVVTAPGGDASGNFTNSGSIVIAGAAHALATDGSALAIAGGTTLIEQFIGSRGGDAAAVLDNSGSLMAVESAAATGTGATAVGAINDGLKQIVQAGSGSASGLFNNDGEITLAAVAHAEGHGGFRTIQFTSSGATFTQTLNLGISAIATVHTGIAQAVSGRDGAAANFANSGSIMLAAVAEASGAGAILTTASGATLVDNVAAVAGISTGLRQFAGATEDAVATLANSGSFEANAYAAAANNGTGTAFAGAIAANAISQFATAADGGAQADISNSGTLNVLVDAKATAEHDANAQAIISDALLQHAQGVVTAVSNIANAGELNLLASASASAGTDGFGFGVAAVQGVLQQAVALSASTHFNSSSNGFTSALDLVPSGPATLSLQNDGSIAIAAHAVVAGGGSGDALAIATGIAQSGSGSAVGVSLTNDGMLNIAALATATADHAAFATAFAVGIEQSGFGSHIHFTNHSTFSGGHQHHSSVFADGSAAVSISNSGTVRIDAIAEAHAISGSGSAIAAAIIPTGIHQLGFAESALLSVDNSGRLEIAGMAVADAPNAAQAVARAGGIFQQAFASSVTSSTAATLSGATTVSQSNRALTGKVATDLKNDGTLSVMALASAHAGSSASASAHASGVGQVGVAASAALQVENQGTFNVLALAKASGTDATGQGFAVGLQQTAIASDAGTVSLDNNGHLTVMADVAATGSRSGNGLAIATGVQQDLSAATATAAVSNAGTMAVIANVNATGSTFANGEAIAAGIRQLPLTEDLNEILHNSGKFSVAAIAAVDAGDGTAAAAATATGYEAFGHNIHAGFENSGTLNVLADAQALAGAGFAEALAIGVDIAALQRVSNSEVHFIDGTIKNSGILHVVASADGPNADATRAVANSQATAIGIRLTSGTNGVAITNSGTIMVEAVATNNRDARATGILVNSNGSGGDPNIVLEINNSGNLIVRQSVDGGESWHRGTAIDLRDAPNNSVVNLNGGSYIYGNIDVQAGDKINVAGGTVALDGIIGANYFPTKGITAGVLDSGLSGAGALNIASGGNLQLVNPLAAGSSPGSDGPAYAIANSLTVNAGGTLTFQLMTSKGGAQQLGTYSQIFVDTASLGGSLVAQIVTPNGLFADEYHWDNVIDANSITGKFDSCTSNSVLLTFTCTYDSNSNVDLSLTRVAFDAIGGLNRNGTSTGDGLESLYDMSLTVDAAALFGQLFTIRDAGAYNQVLNQLSGSTYANYLQSLPSLGVHYNQLIEDGVECSGSPLQKSALECRDPSPVRVWGRFDYQRSNVDGDGEAGAVNAHRISTIAGADVAVGEDAIVGVSGGYVTNHLRDKQFGDSIKGDGVLVGAYADYDPGSFFVKGVLSYSWLSGDSTRHIDFQGLAPGSNFAALAKAKPGATLFTAALHAGARLPTGGKSFATPYVDLDYVRASLDSFREDGASAASLDVDGGTSSHAFATAGVKWTSELGSLVPQFNLAYRHRFGNERSAVDERFAAGGDDFNIISAAQKRDSYIAGLSLGGTIGRVNVAVSYEGEFNSDVTNQSASVKLVLPLGKSK